MLHFLSVTAPPIPSTLSARLCLHTLSTVPVGQLTCSHLPCYKSVSTTAFVISIHSTAAQKTPPKTNLRCRSTGRHQHPSYISENPGATPFSRGPDGQPITGVSKFDHCYFSISATFSLIHCSHPGQAASPPSATSNILASCLHPTPTLIPTQPILSFLYLGPFHDSHCSEY